MIRKSRRLKDIEADEISLVESAANRKKFFLILKAATAEFNTILENFFGEALYKSELKDVEVRGDLSPEALKAIKSALEMLAQYKDDYPDLVLRAIAVLSKFALGEGDGAYPPKKKPKGRGGKDDEEGYEEEERKFLKRRALERERAGLQPSTMLAGKFSMKKEVPFHWSSFSGDPDLEDEDDDELINDERPVSKGLESDEADAGGRDDLKKSDAELWPSLCGGE